MERGPLWLFIEKHLAGHSLGPLLRGMDGISQRKHPLSGLA